MIRINLLPYRVAKRQQQVMQHVAMFAVVVAAALLLTLAAHSVASWELSGLEDESAQLQQQNTVLKKKIGKLRNLDKLREEVQRKLEIIDQLQNGRFRSLKTLHEVSRVIPDNVWVESVKDHGDKIELSGLGESNKAIANFMRSLDKSPLFSDIKLLVISRVTVGDLPVRKFSLHAAHADMAAKKKEQQSAAGKKRGR